MAGLLAASPLALNASIFKIRPQQVGDAVPTDVRNIDESGLTTCKLTQQRVSRISSLSSFNNVTNTFESDYVFEDYNPQRNDTDQAARVI